MYFAIFLDDDDDDVAFPLSLRCRFRDMATWDWVVGIVWQMGQRRAVRRECSEADWLRMK